MKSSVFSAHVQCIVLIMCCNYMDGLCFSFPNDSSNGNSSKACIFDGKISMM